MHHIYHTDAFVLKTLPTGEDSKTLFLYTRELGLVRARAQGIRKISSKLRYTLQEYSRANVDLVRGKEIWRVTTASPLSSHSEIRRTPSAEKIIARMHSLLVRLVTGEEANEEIFSILVRAHDMLGEREHSSEEYRAVELLFAARILTALGYLTRGSLSENAGTSGIPIELSDIAYQHRLIRDINQALSESQL